MASPERKWYQNGTVCAGLFVLGLSSAVIGLAYSDEIAEALAHDTANPALIADYEPYAEQEAAGDLVQTGFNIIAASALAGAGAIIIRQARQELE